MKSHESELYLEAMLYLLDDPSLDRLTFERRLADDPQLGEILAESVLLYQSLKSLDAESLNTVVLAKLSKEAILPAVNVHHGDQSTQRTWWILAGLAASFLLLGYLGFSGFHPFGSPAIEVARLDNSANPSLDGSSMFDHEHGSWSNVVWAWGELRTDDSDEHSLRHASFIESDNGGSLSDANLEDDVPEWLILATAAVLEDSNGGGASIDESESRTLYQ